MHPIVACSTPWGRAAISVVRLSGFDLKPLLQEICRPRGGFPPPRRSRLASLVEGGEVFDEGLLTFFPQPASYTGEDCAEISCHGNPLVVERLLAAAVAAGARMAEPGEFTRRALLNGRIDLPRAEAVLQAIDATSHRGLDIARAGQSGEVSALVVSLAEGLRFAIAELEAALDYPGEVEGPEDLEQKLRDLGQRAQAAADTFQAGRVLVEGARVAIVGPVNAGKSSLFNALGGSTRALVSPTPGTTRDVVERRVVVDSVAVTLLDTAGERDTDDPLERAGRALGQEMSDDADLLLVVLPAHAPQEADGILARTEGRSRLLVGNHMDRTGAVSRYAGHELIPTCATRGDGIEALGCAIANALVGEEPGEAQLVIASQRQRDRLLEVVNCVDSALQALDGEAGPAVAAEELYRALERLDALLGRDTREAVLDVLFTRFCIGK